MHLSTVLYHDQEDLTRLIEEQEIEDDPGLLVLIYTGIPEQTYIQGLLTTLSKRFPRATLCGTTTGGEIARGHAREHTTLLSFCRFEDTTLHSSIVADHDLDSRAMGRRIGQANDTRNARLLITFATGLSTDGEAFVQGIEDTAPGVAIAGGLAGDNRRFRETLVFTRDGILNRGAAAVTLHNPALALASRYALDWMPLGRPLEITRAEGNRVYTIYGRPAAESYERYLGKDISARLPALGMQFPLIVERDGLPIARMCLGMQQDGSLVYSGRLHEGEQVRFGLGDPNSVVKSLRQTHRELSAEAFEGMLVFSSVARKRMMKNSADLDAHYLDSIAPTSGFFSYGEFFSMPRGNRFFNHTMTAFGISETRVVQAGAPTDTGTPSTTDTHLELRALSHLVSVTQEELEHVNASLEHLATTDPLTSVLNRRKLNELMDKEIERCRRYERGAAVILFDLDDFKKINDRHGHEMGDVVLKTVCTTVSEVIRNTDFLGRWGGEEFLILSTETSEEEARSLAERIRRQIAQRHATEALEVTVSVGVTAVRPDDTLRSLITRVDHALYSAKHAGKNRIYVDTTSMLSLVSASVKGPLQ